MKIPLGATLLETAPPTVLDAYVVLPRAGRADMGGAALRTSAGGAVIRGGLIVALPSFPAPDPDPITMILGGPVDTAGGCCCRCCCTAVIVLDFEPGLVGIPNFALF